MTGTNDTSTRHATATTGPDVDDVHSVFIRTRVPLHLAQRTGTRVNQLISPFWADRTPAHRAITVGLGAADLVIARVLHTDPRLNLRWRLPLDAAELALAYATAVRDDYDEASVPSVMGCPLAVEAGARLGWRGLAVPAVNLTVGTLVRKARGHAPRTGTMAWQVAAAVGGMGIAAYGRRRRRAAVEQHRRERVALEYQAELEGRHDIAVGRDVVLDDIQRATALIDLAVRNPRTHSNPAGEWKAELAATTRGAYAYAGDVLSGWQARHNAASPDLRTVVRLELPPHQAPTILARSQADELETALDRAQLRGTVKVEVYGRRDSVEVLVAERRIVLPVPLGQPRISFDPVPGAFLWSALWLLAAGAASREHVPRWAAVGPAAVAVGMAVGAHRLGERHAGRAPRTVVTAWSAALTLASTVLHTRTMRNTHGHDDISRYPYSLALRGFGLVALLTWSELDRRSKAAAAAGAATVGLAWQLSPAPRSGRELVAELAWPLQSVALGGSLIASIDDDANRLGHEMHADDLDALGHARAKGRVDTIEFASRCLADAEAALIDDVDDLPDDIAAEVRRRLDDCHRQLEQLEHEHAADRARLDVRA